jgi:hypothetical protein
MRNLKLDEVKNFAEVNWLATDMVLSDSMSDICS